jgi:glutathione S-transferase
MKSPYTLYDYLPSGNGYKSSVDGEVSEYPVQSGRNGHPPRSNPSPGILGDESQWQNSLMPADPWERANLWRWLCFELYNLEPNVATIRSWVKILNKTAAQLGERLTEKFAKGHEALAVLELGLEGKDFLVAERFTLADIALYAYRHVAHEGGFLLDAYPNICAWLALVAAQARHAPISAA